jgi:EpsI family protein
VNLRSSTAISISMLAAAALAYVGTPRERMADPNNPLVLERIVPKEFDGWRIDTTVVPVTVSQDVQRTLDRLYSQTLSRTYVNPNGDRVMLSLAYGGTQSRDLQVHRPEVCYSAQGFNILAVAKATLSLGSKDIPVMHVLAKQGARDEPITYWVRIGDRVVRGNVEQGLARLEYGLSGKLPDGLLFRVSTISKNPELGYSAQQEFVRALLRAVSEGDRRLLVGGGA